MAPYEASYERPCRSPLCWTKVVESSITGPDMIREGELDTIASSHCSEPAEELC